MPYTIYIRRNSDGEIRPYHEPYYSWEDGQDCMWSDGNYGCDCNRHLFFVRSGGEVNCDDAPCGTTAYSISRVELPDGSNAYIDFD